MTKILKICSKIGLIIAMIITVYSVSPSSEIQAIPSAPYESDTGYTAVLLEGVSTNSHTKPYILWVQNKEIHVAVTSTHGIKYMTLDGNSSTGTSKLPEESPLSVDNYVGLYPSAILKGNVKDSRWEIFSFELSILDASGAYTMNIVSDVGEGHNVINEIFNVVMPTATANLTKTWIDGPMTDVDIQLYRQVSGGSLEVVGLPITLKPDAKHEATYKWENLPFTNDSAKTYTYSISEADPGQGYIVDFSSSYDQNTKTYTFTLTNTYSAPKGPITARKEWVGGPSTHPTIQLQLYRNGSAYLAPVELVDGETTHTWNDLDKTDSNGDDYVYTVDEVEIPAGYFRIIDGLTITNVLIELPDTGGEDPIIKLPDTGGMNGQMFMMFGAGVTLVGALIAIRKRKEDEEE